MTYARLMDGAIRGRVAVITHNSVQQKLATRPGVLAMSIRNNMQPFDLLTDTISSRMEEYCARG